MDIEWIVLPRRTGQRIKLEARVTIAWRKNGGPSLSRSFSGFFNISRTLLAELGWAKGQKLQIAHDPSRTRLRLCAAPEGFADGYVLGGKDSTGTLNLTMPWVAVRETRIAENVAHQVAAGALVLTLPEWARGEGPAMPDMPAAMPDKEPTIADKTAASADSGSPAPPAASTASVGVKWSPERKGLLRELWLARTETAEIARRLCELPGPAVSRSDVSAYAVAALKLPTQGAMTAAAAPVPAPRDPAGAKGRGPDRGASLPVENKDKAEAVKLLEAGMSGRAVADELGLPLTTVSNWAAEVRLKQRASQAGKAA